MQLDLLSPDEQDKVRSKRERNKLAAQKCRIKRREQVQQIQVKYSEYLDAIKTLQAELTRLEEEDEVLQRLLENQLGQLHWQVCS